MTGRICYLTRADRGGRLVRVRLVGERTGESFSPLGARGASLAGPGTEIDAAAEWIADRVSGRDASIRLLCVDLDGAVCSWLTTPSADPEVVAAALAQREGATAWAAEEGGPARSAALMPPPSTDESSVQALSKEANGRAGRTLLARRDADAAGKRLAVLAVPDVLARLLIDALDERGIEVGGVVSLWHAMATAWDPAAAGSTGPRADRVVATNAAVTAIALIDPEGRLAWAWSREGELLAGGTIRLAVDAPPAPPERREGALARHVEDREPPGLPRLGQPEVARLTADWLAWSAQLGIVPTRILCIGPAIEADGESLGPAELGSALGRSWAGATVDLAVHDDPIGATLERLAREESTPADPAEDPRAGLVALSRRPGRSHRALYRWAAAAVLAAAAALGVVAWKAWDAADDATERAQTLQAQTEQAIAQAVPRLANDPFKRRKFEDELKQMRQQKTTAQGMRPAKPILEELETISYVLAGSGAHITDLSLRDSSVHLILSVPDTRTGEEIFQSLNAIEGSHVQWIGRFTGNAEGGRLQYTLDGAWIEPAGRPATPQPARPAGGGPA